MRSKILTVRPRRHAIQINRPLFFMQHRRPIVEFAERGVSQRVGGTNDTGINICLNIHFTNDAQLGVEHRIANTQTNIHATAAFEQKQKNNKRFEHAKDVIVAWHARAAPMCL